MTKVKRLWRSIGGEPKAKAQERHRLLVVRLDRENARGDALDCLRDCGSQRPCRLEACPKCVRWFRREYLRAFLRAELDRGIFTRVSVILGGQAVRPGHFQPEWLSRLVGAVCKQIERSELHDSIILGGIDLSLNVFANSERWWLPHAYLLINKAWSPDLERIVRGAFRLCQDVRRPVGLKQVDASGLLGCVTYSYKNGFYRRSSYLEPDRQKRDGTPRENVRSQSLSPASEVELARSLAEYSVGSRMIMRNVRRTTSPNSDRVGLTLRRPIMRA